MNCQPNPCPSDLNPLIGFSAENPPAPRFVGLGFGSVVPPPLNFEFNNPNCFAVSYSTVSQSDADALALASSLSCSSVTAPDPLYYTYQFASDVFDGVEGGITTPPLT